MAVVAVAVHPNHIGFSIYFVDRFADIFGRFEIFRDFINAVNKHKRSNF